MRFNLWSACAAVVLIAAAGCSSGGKPAPTAFHPTGDARLVADFPTAGDLTAGWSGPAQVDAASVATGGLAGCPALDPNISQKLLPNQTEAEYRQNSEKLFMIEVLSTGPSAQDAAAWSQFTGAVTTCQSFNTGSGTAAVSWALETDQVFIPPAGMDDSLAYANIGAAAANPNIGIEEDFILLRKGDVIAEIIVYSPNAIGSTSLNALIDKVAAKIK